MMHLEGGITAERGGMLIFRTSDCTTKDFQAPSAPASPSRPRAPFRQAGGFAPMSPLDPPL